jgi:hypothetical protein
LNQFEKDLDNFGVQFGNIQSNGNVVPQNRAAASSAFGQDVNNIRPTTFNQIILNSFINPKQGIPTQTTPKTQLFTTQKPRVTPAITFNRPSTTTSTTPQPTTSTTAITTVRTTTNPVTTPTTEREENKNAKGVSIPVETTTNKNNKITFTFNGVSN